MSIKQAADRLAHDMIIHGIAYFEEGGDAETLKAMAQRITGALGRIDAKAGQPMTSTAEVADALGIDTSDIPEANEDWFQRAKSIKWAKEQNDG